PDVAPTASSWPGGGGATAERVDQAPILAGCELIEGIAHAFTGARHTAERLLSRAEHPARDDADLNADAWGIDREPAPWSWMTARAPAELCNRPGWLRPSATPGSWTPRSAPPRSSTPSSGVPIRPSRAHCWAHRSAVTVGTTC